MLIQKLILKWQKLQQIEVLRKSLSEKYSQSVGLETWEGIVACRESSFSEGRVESHCSDLLKLGLYKALEN